MTRKFLKHFPWVIGVYWAGIASAYLAYLFINRVMRQPDFISIIHFIWSYPVFTKDNNPISLGKITICLGLILLGIQLSKVISEQLAKRVFPRFKLEKGAVAALENLSYYGFLIFFTLFALNTANVPLAMFTVLGGAVAIGVGFGSQNLMNNFISGVILQLERPIKVGDTIEMDGSKGVVHHIGARSTVINCSNGTTFVLPNSNFLEKKVVNYSLLDNRVRSEVKIIVPVGTDLEKIKPIIEAKIAGFPEVLASPHPELMFIDYLDAGTFISLNLFFWIQLRDNVSKTDIESRARFEIYKIVSESETKP
jgi:potassium efflux system protein